MRIRSVFMSVVVVGAMTFGAATPQYGQNAAVSSPSPDHARHLVAISILRAINTAEAGYRAQNGAYANWDTLLMSREAADYLAKCAAQIEERPGAHFSKGPEIWPGWTLRLDLTDGDHGYDLMLENTTDKTCGYAAVTDDRGVIRQSKAIDCDI